MNVAPRDIDLDFVILGGGILGTAVAALASVTGYRVLALRLRDNGVPRADTLRNQGWLQSGMIYRSQDFEDEDAYRVVAKMTYEAGRLMLQQCEIPLDPGRGVVRVKDNQRAKEIRKTAKWLRLPPDDFCQLSSNEAQDQLGALYERGSTYFMVPDTPFDEAGVLSYLRALALRNGALFEQLDTAAKLEPCEVGLRISWSGVRLESPLTFVAAGAGMRPLLEQLGKKPPVGLHQTPLLVHDGLCGLEVPILVDLDRKYSAVRHIGPLLPCGAIVVGTKVKTRRALFAEPEERAIPPKQVKQFEECLHPHLKNRVSTGRFTAGFELIPHRRLGISSMEPWLKDFGSFVVGSPGRATLGMRAAERALAMLIQKVAARDRRPFKFVRSGANPWNDEIRMHFNSHYTFNDAEKSK